MPTMSRSRISAALVVVFATFVIFGLPDGIFGTLWPTQRADMGLAIGDLSWVITALTVGGFTGSVLSGHITRRLGTSAGIRLALGASFVGLVGFGLAPNLPSLIVISVFAGGGAGLLDPIVNAWVSLRHSAKVMGFLHAFFGLGAALGPPFATTAVGNGMTWRGVFVIVGIAELVLLALVWAKRHDFDTEELHEKHHELPAVSPSSGGLLQLTLVWFFLIVGLEVSIGAWAFSLLFEERGVSEATAALWVAGFWGTFTAGRVVLGLVGDRLPQEPALWVSLAITTIGAALMWANPNDLPAGISLPVLGAGVSLLFPVMVLVTPRWLGPQRAAVATGYQFGAASIGSVSFSILIGQLAEIGSLEVLGPVLFFGAVATIATLAMTRTASARQVRVAAGIPTRED